MPQRLILGIESSCDETSAAVVAGGRTVLSNVVASQMVHAGYGGVVPELASREHLRAVVPIAREAMRQAGLSAGAEGYRQLEAVAVTEGPGLAGALLVGITFAKGLAFAAGKPLIAVNHLEGHIQAVLLEAETHFAEVSPLLAAVISGGHSHLYLAMHDADGLWRYRNVGRTVDDAAGEAYDKVAKLLGLPYPGGPWIDALAPHGNPTAVPFRFAEIKSRPPSSLLVIPEAGSPASLLAGVQGNLRADVAQTPDATTPERRFDLSFSGIKTAARRYLEFHRLREAATGREAALREEGLLTAKPNDPAAFARVLQLVNRPSLDLLASFQAAVTAHLTRTILHAAAHHGARAVAVSGGVAANRELRRRLQAEAARQNLPLTFPSLGLSTDNAAMIAAAAWPKLLNRQFAPDTLEATPNLRLG